MEVLTVNYNDKNAAKLFCQSLQQTGFAVLRNHNIDSNLIDRAYQAWQDFFDAEEKHQFTYQKPEQDGYFPFRTETAKNHNKADLKEFYHFYPWGKIPAQTKEVSFAISSALTQLAREILQWVEQELPQSVADKLSMPLSNMIVDSKNTLLRILHYPPLSADFNEPAVRAAPHEDINLLTLLPAATAPGLQVMSIDQKWHAVDCDKGNIVVNVGDMLQVCTRQFYKSTTHRVVNPDVSIENISRYSMPFFLHPRGDVLLSETLTAEAYLHERLHQIGIY